MQLNGSNKKVAREGLSAKRIVARETNSSLLADRASVWQACRRDPREQLIGPVTKLRQRRSHVPTDSAPPFWRLFPLLQAEEYKYRRGKERFERNCCPPSSQRALTVGGGGKEGKGENA